MGNGKIIMPDEIQKEIEKKSLTPEQRIERLENKIESLKVNLAITLNYIQADLFQKNYDYQSAFKKITDAIQAEGVTTLEDGQFKFPDSVENSVPEHVKLMWLISNQILIIRKL